MYLTLCLGSMLANIEETHIMEISSSQAANTFSIVQGCYTAVDILHILNDSLTSIKLEVTDMIADNDFRLKYKFVRTQPASLDRISLKISRQFAFFLGLIPYHVALKSYSKDNNITFNLVFNDYFWLDTISHLSNISLVSSSNTFNFNKIGQIMPNKKDVEGMITGDTQFATYELGKNWSAISMRNPDLSACQFNLYDMLNCRIKAFYMEVIIDFSRLIIVQ